MKRVLGFLLLGVITTLATSCHNSGSSTTPTTLTVPLVTENFTGTVDPGGQSANPFNVTTSGYQVNVILTAAGPPATIQTGLGVGTWANSTCTLLTNGYVTTPAGSTAQLSGTVNA